MVKNEDKQVFTIYMRGEGSIAKLRAAAKAADRSVSSYVSLLVKDALNKLDAEQEATQ